MRDGGRSRDDLDRYVYRPMETATAGPLAGPPCPCMELASDAGADSMEDGWRKRSPRIQTSACMTVLPPTMMRWVPRTCARRETLFPVS